MSSVATAEPVMKPSPGFGCPSTESRSMAMAAYGIAWQVMQQSDPRPCGRTTATPDRA